MFERPYEGMMVVTLPKTNIFAPKNGWLEDEFPIGALPIFMGYVSFREGNPLDKA